MMYIWIQKKAWSIYTNILTAFFPGDGFTVDLCGICLFTSSYLPSFLISATQNAFLSVTELVNIKWINKN